MMDQIFDRNYQAGRADLHDGIDLLVSRLGAAAGNAFKVLNRIEYDAPWKAPRRRAGRA